MSFYYILDIAQNTEEWLAYWEHQTEQKEWTETNICVQQRDKGQEYHDANPEYSLRN